MSQSKKCKDCEHFKIAYQPMMPWDSGLAVCEKLNLECDFTSMRKINALVCAEGGDDSEPVHSRG